MDLILLVGIAIALLVIIITIYLLQKKSTQTGDKTKQQHHQQRPTAVRAAEGIPRRAQIARNQRNRLRTNAAANVAEDQDDDDVEEVEAGPSTSHEFPEEKMGAKKRAKLEAKADKRMQREQEMKSKEERKAREEKLDEERKKQEEKEAEDERKAAEAERLAREERERKEHEEYLKMKAAFSVEEEGFEEGEESEKENLLQEFIQYIKDNKVVVLEDLATHFKLKTQQAIDRITELQANGSITGVIDDRGKFIYITEDELLAVAKFINQRGRVSISELAECSNNLINLTPDSK
ncbi:DDRGK domain-containing protein 1 [Episyrphus balteatus]|uniref:DDRGK domain-containing protein 1 n=1 Tax=Episyrphus balteatus TaxID=286459 RepID=UPI002486294D|nr:DDRGK domain-containing protein 1 [Episyrphus balteatus]